MLLPLLLLRAALRMEPKDCNGPIADYHPAKVNVGRATIAVNERRSADVPCSAIIRRTTHRASTKRRSAFEGVAEVR